MDKYEKKILKYFLNKGRGRSVEAYVLQKEVGIPLDKFSDVIGSCIDRKYLWHSPDARGSKYSQYGLEEIGWMAIDEEMKNGKNNSYKLVGIIVSIAAFVVTVISLI